MNSLELVGLLFRARPRRNPLHGHDNDHDGLEPKEAEPESIKKPIVHVELDLVHLEAQEWICGLETEDQIQDVDGEPDETVRGVSWCSFIVGVFNCCEEVAQAQLAQLLRYHCKKMQESNENFNIKLGMAVNRRSGEEKKWQRMQLTGSLSSFEPTRWDFAPAIGQYEKRGKSQEEEMPKEN